MRRHPVGECCAAYVVSEADHAGDGDPAVLAEPAVSTPGTGAGAYAAVGRARIGVGEARVRREDRRGSVGVCEREDGRGDVGVRGGVVIQRVAVLHMQSKKLKR